MASRYKFIDILRGLAILFMVLNHTARWWLDKSLSFFSYHMIYSTVTLAAPLFLFVVGFCLVISYQKNLKSKTNWQIVSKYLIRGFGVMVIGYVFSLIVFGFGDIWGGKVLQAIGASIIVSLPILYLLQFKRAIKYLIGLACLLPISFWLLFQPFSAWLNGHFWIGEIFFKEFPLWPYFSLVLFGLILGKYFVDYSSDPDKLKTFFVQVFNWGFGLVVSALVLVLARSVIFRVPLISFENDYALNHCWIPGIITSIWIVGAILLILSFSYFSANKLGRASFWLEKLGQSALFVYIFHHLIVFNIFSVFLNFRLNSIFLYFVDVFTLILFLVYGAKFWLWGRGRIFNHQFPIFKQ
ncbi:MAG: heparan-alpha-glucosaminide N-acetyltransferase domain-containing protein [Patescibacteria group bacterium]